MQTRMTRITVPVSVAERDALQALAKIQLRHPRDHARYLLRMALGLTEQESTNDKSALAGQSGGALVPNS